MTRRHTVLDSPLGPLTVVAEDGTLRGLYVEQGLRKALERRSAPAATLGRPPVSPHDTLGESCRPQDDRVLTVVAEQLTAYFARELTAFEVPLSTAGTPFQQRVWSALRAIPYGETRSYGQLAAELGNPAACRAVGAANGRNPVSIVVPCHRVVGSTGRLTGYSGGLSTKELLLAHERAAG